MEQCREQTLALFNAVDHETFCHQAHPDFSPIGWHLGHIAYTEGLWILEKLAGMAPQFPDYRQLFAADALPKRDRVYLPTLAEVKTYLSAIRTQVFDYLKTAPLDEQRRLWLWLLQHESQHCETIAIVLALLSTHSPTHSPTHHSAEAHGRSPVSHSPVNSRLEIVDCRVGRSQGEMVEVPAGHFDMGNDALETLDNERPVHRVSLNTYWIDRTPVTCQQYGVFMRAGGYQDPRWWSPEGWAWLQANPVAQPLYWKEDAIWETHPVCGVSWYEAEAYANFVGKRLPTEAEWEKAASWHPHRQQRQLFPWGEQFPDRDRCNHHHHIGHTTPIHHYPAGKSPYGCEDMLGNVWEWTASWFAGYPGYQSYPYRGYSQAYFDQKHRVLKGGSWATRSWALRSAFRNWYHPHVREIFAGFRCAQD
ncbi:MAG: ergothioneine biosynthesis protein EgtB [Oscillatoriales cyanobacterium C42_A2020_001]|nr:ergothioneine biosynthesis protein EgtB [Leptolyngbyaceae cyanobacterium C42_A2020_001]